MPFDRAAHGDQVARIAAHTAGGEVLLRWHGKGNPFPAAIAAERPRGAEVHRDVGAQTLVVVTLARHARDSADVLVFASEQPREGQHFTCAGKIYRIEEDRTVPHGPVLTYHCAVSNLAA